MNSTRSPHFHGSEAANVGPLALLARQWTMSVEVASVATECRELQATVSTPDKKSESNFTACKAPDGAWELN